MPATPSAANKDRMQAAIELRRAGLSYREIAERLTLKSAGAARNLLHVALDQKLREKPGDVRDLEVQRLNRLLGAVWSKAVGGDEKAIDRALKIMERRALLLGLNQSDPANTGRTRNARRSAATKSKNAETEEISHDQDAVAEILAVLAETGCFTAPPAGTDEAAAQ